MTHRFSSGAAYAPTAITYSIYEEGNTTGLDEDVDMTPASPFDAIVGAYYARRQLTAAAGFEAGKTYVVIIKATVDSVAAIEMHIFQIRVQQTGDAYAVVAHADYGNAKLVRSTTPANTLSVDATHLVAVPTTQEVAANLTKILGTALTETAGQIAAAFKKFFDKASPTGTINSLPDAVAGASGGLPTTNGTKINQTADLTAGQSIACSDKTGFSLSATGADLILKSSTFVQAIVAAINELATYGLTALNTLLVTTGIKAATIADKTGYSLSVTPPTAAQVADVVWDEMVADHQIANSMGNFLNQAAQTYSRIGSNGAGLTAIPWNAAWDAEVQAACTDALNAYDPPTNAEMEARTLAAASYATAVNQTTIIGYLDTEIAAILEDTGTTLPAILATLAGYVDTEVSAIKDVTDKLLTAMELDGAVYRFTANALEEAPTGGGTAPTVGEIADAVCDELLADHVIVGSVGAGIAAAGSAGDPWSTPLPGAYGEGTAGHIIGHPSVVLPVMQGQAYTATAIQGREVVVVQGDTPRITFDLNADYTGWTVYFAAKATLADTDYVINPKAGSWTDIEEGQGYVDLTALETATRGKYFAEIELRNGESRLTAMKFYLKIIDAVIKE